MLIKSEQSNFFSVRLYHWYQTTEYMCQIKIILGGKSQPKEIDNTGYKAMAWEWSTKDYYDSTVGNCESYHVSSHMYG